jgi:membrane complex biogenesis BtpA family protein
VARPAFLARPPRLVGVVHLAALPGAPGFSGSLAAVVARARADAAAYRAAGFDAVIVENYGDAPFFRDDVPKETVAAMAVCADEVVHAAPGLLVGTNVLRNDARAAVAVAAAAGLHFVRVNVLAGVVATDQGLIEGRAAEVARDRARLAPALAVVADVHVKHGRPLARRPIEEEARDLAGRAGAHALVVTGTRTGASVDLDELRAVRAALPDVPLYAGSGTTAETVAETLRLATGVIVGTSVKRGGRTRAPVDAKRARAYVAAARRRTPR